VELKDLVLAAMSPAAQGGFSPVQVQKLFFLIDRKLGVETGGPHFRFRAYDYGPFDPGVYAVLEELERDGLVEVWNRWGRAERRYQLTAAGCERGAAALRSLGDGPRDLMARLVEFVRAASFHELVSAIYKAYPDMKGGSVFSP
jgi:uncharacterized protein YwgA